MSGFGVLIFIFLNSMLFLCNGKVNPPPDGTRLTFLNGSTATIPWTLDGVSGILARTWSFINSDGSEAPIARIILNNTPEIDSSFPRAVSVKKPATLILHNVTEKYNGTYRFNLAASIGGDRSEVVVYIAVTPSVWINCSRVTTVNTSDDFTCVCKGEGGNPPAEVTWYKENKKMDTGVEEATLRLRNVTKNDNGSYTCEAKSHEKAKNEAEIELIVVLKPSVTINCTNTTANEGDDIICDCECKDGNPPAECSWYKNGSRITKIGIELSPLFRYNVSGNDRGKYTCVGQSLTARDEMSINVTVFFKPRNTEVKFSKNPAVINGSVAITCTSDGFPELSYAFSHNDTDLNSTGNVYVIHNVAWKNAGTYNCTANNTLGIDSDSKILTVIRESKSSSAIMASSTIMPSPTVIPSLRTPAPTNTTTPTSNTTGNGTNDNGSKGSNIPAIAGGAAAGGAALATMAAAYYKSKKRDNKRVISNYGMEAIDYDTVKPPDKGEGSQKTEKPEDSHENRKGNTER